jgi:nitroreductase
MLTVTEALRRRISIREFLPTPVTRAEVAAVLEEARWSPSGGNVQPWKVIAVAGAERDAVIELARHRDASHGAAAHGGAPVVGAADEAGAYPIYPANLWEPYRSRRFKVGEDMYALLGIERGDRARRLRRFERNFEFFGAPVGLFFAIDRRMGHGQWAHLGMFMQSIALVAVEHGLGTCMQEAWGMLRESLRRHFKLPESELVYCGMALGHPDSSAAVNALRSDRAPVHDFAEFRGFP